MTIIIPCGISTDRYETFREASNNYNYEGVISYNRNIKKVSLSANLGTSMQKNDWYKLWNQVSQLAAPDVKSLSNNASILSGTESVNAKEKQSVFGMLSLGYHGLFVDGTSVTTGQVLCRKLTILTSMPPVVPVPC